MMPTRHLPRAVVRVPRTAIRCQRCKSNRAVDAKRDIEVRPTRNVEKGPDTTPQSSYRTSLLGMVVAGGVCAAVAGYFLQSDQTKANEVRKAEAKLEKPRKQTKSKEEARDLISSQHLQVKRSRENPGLYAWGSNAGRVAAPDSDDAFVKTPRRIPFFDGRVLRDVKLDRNFGAAVDEKGNLLQWGTGYSSDSKEPVITLRGKNLIQIGTSKDRIVGLGKDGTVYSVPVSKEEQDSGPKPEEASWMPMFGQQAAISYRVIRPQNLGWGEKVTSLAVGQEHALLATNGWRVYSIVASTTAFPSKGQMGIPGLTFDTRPVGPVDQPHEIINLREHLVEGVAAGDYHSLVIDRNGRAISFGDNSSGQLGIGTDDIWTPLPRQILVDALYRGSGCVSKVSGIAAGGMNSFIEVEATKMAATKDDPNQGRDLGRVFADTWAFGQGVTGTLGNNKWTHVQSTPTKIPALSGLFEYDEKDNKVVPIRLARLSVGSSHAAAVMQNITKLDVEETDSEHETNWGRDVLLFGGNDSYQIGTGKRNNIPSPTYINALDQDAEREVRGKEKHRFHITPRATVKVNGKQISMEQRIECGRGVTAVYSGL